MPRVRDKSTWKIKVRKDTGVLQVEWYDQKGKRKFRSLDSRGPITKALEKKAELIAKQSVVPTIVETVEPLSGEVTMRQLFERCRTARDGWHPSKCKSQATIRSNIKILNEYIGDELLQNMTAKRLRILADELAEHGGNDEEGYASGTVRRKMQAVGRALGFATEEEDRNGTPWLFGKPKMPKISGQNYKDRIVSDEEEDAIFKAIDQRIINEPTRDWWKFRYLVRFLLDTGCRLSEGTHLQVTQIVKQVDNEGNEELFAKFPRTITKNGKPLMVPLTDDITANIPSMIAGARGKDIFPGGHSPDHRNGFYSHMWNLVREDIQAQGKFDFYYVEQPGSSEPKYESVSFHTFRHTCATRLVSEGIELAKVSNWLNHSSLQVTIDRYAHYAPESHREARDALNRRAKYRSFLKAV